MTWLIPDGCLLAKAVGSRVDTKLNAAEVPLSCFRAGTTSKCIGSPEQEISEKWLRSSQCFQGSKGWEVPQLQTHLASGSWQRVGRPWTSPLDLGASQQVIRTWVCHDGKGVCHRAVPVQINPLHCQILQTSQKHPCNRRLLGSRRGNQPFKPEPDSKWICR